MAELFYVREGGIWNEGWKRAVVGGHVPIDDELERAGRRQTWHPVELIFRLFFQPPRLTRCEAWLPRAAARASRGPAGQPE